VDDKLLIDQRVLADNLEQQPISFATYPLDNRISKVTAETHALTDSDGKL